MLAWYDLGVVRDIDIAAEMRRRDGVSSRRAV